MKFPPGGGGVTVPGVELLGVGSFNTIGESGSFIDGGVAGSWNALMGVGRGSGPTRAEDAAGAALSSPLLEVPMERARRVAEHSR